jgi:hypothetical protein
MIDAKLNGKIDELKALEKKRIALFVEIQDAVTEIAQGRDYVTLSLENISFLNAVAGCAVFKTPGIPVDRI